MSIDLLEIGDLGHFFTEPDQFFSGEEAVIRFNELNEEDRRNLNGSLGYYDVINLNIGEADDEYTRGILIERTDNSSKAALIAKYGKLHRFTISGTDADGYEAAYTDTCDNRGVYMFEKDVKLVPFAYKRIDVDGLLETVKEGRYFTALERCGYSVLRPSRQSTHSGWLRSVVGHS